MEGGELADEKENLKLELAEVTRKWKDEREQRQKVQSELSSIKLAFSSATPGPSRTSSKTPKKSRASIGSQLTRNSMLSTPGTGARSNRGFVSSPSNEDRNLNDTDLMAIELNALRLEVANLKSENLELERKARVFEIKAINKSESSDEVLNRLKRSHELKINELEAEVDELTNLLEEANHKIRWLEEELAATQQELSVVRESTDAATQALMDMELKFDLARGKTTKVRARLDACYSHQRAHNSPCGGSMGLVHVQELTAKDSTITKLNSKIAALESKESDQSDVVSTIMEVAQLRDGNSGQQKLRLIMSAFHRHAKTCAKLLRASTELLMPTPASNFAASHAKELKECLKIGEDHQAFAMWIRMISNQRPFSRWRNWVLLMRASQWVCIDIAPLLSNRTSMDGLLGVPRSAQSQG